MVTTRFRLKVGNIEVEMEGDQEYIEKKFSELYNKFLEEKPELLHKQLSSSSRQPEAEEELLIERKPDLDEIFEYKEDGTPQLAVPSGRLSLSEVIALLLYAYEPRRLTMQQLKKIISDNWKGVEMTAIGATMATTMKNRVVKEGKRGSYTYSLTKSGRELAQGVITKLKGVDNSQ